MPSAFSPLLTAPFQGSSFVGAACLVLGLLWTGFAGTLAIVASWASDSLHPPGSPLAERPAPPAWLADWVPAEAWAATVAALQERWQTALDVLPALGTVAGWLPPLVWLAWAAGLGLLLLLAGSLQTWLARIPPPSPARR